MTDDAELLRRYAEEGSDEAFAELVGRHIDFVYAAALRQARGNAPLAQDVVQAVFSDVARKARALAAHAVLVGWLHTATRFAAAKAVRAESRRHAREQEAHAMNEALRGPERPVEWERLRPVLDEVLGELKERERVAILLRFFEKRPLAEVGAKLALTETAARSCVDRALDKLHAALARRGVTSTAAALGVALANQVTAAAPAGLAASVTGIALAGAGVSGGAASVAAIFNFMSTTKIIVGAAAAIALLAVGVAVYEANAARAATVAINALTGERDGLRAQLVAAGKRGAEERTSAGRTPAAAGVSPSAAAAEIAPTTRAESAIDYVLDHPEVRAIYLQRAVLSIKARFERFFRDAGLTGEQQDRFLKLAMDDAESRLDALAMRRAAGGLDSNGSAMDQAAMERIGVFQRQRDEELVKNLRELLGPQFPAAMQNLNTMEERNVADELASRLYHTDAPLTAQQADRLIAVLVENRYRSSDTMGGIVIPKENQNGAMADPMRMAMPWMGSAPVSDAAVVRAATVLAPTQIAALKVYQAQQAAERRLVPPVASKDKARTK